MDVCPLLDLKDGISNYTLPVRIATALQLTTRNLPPMVNKDLVKCFNKSEISFVVFIGVRIHLHL